MHAEPDITCIRDKKVSETIVYLAVGTVYALWRLECTADPYQHRLNTLEILQTKGKKMIYE